MDHPPLDVRHATNPVEHFLALDVVEERVDGEVPAHGVLVGLAERVVVPDQEVLGVSLLFLGRAPEGRGLDDLPSREQHVDQPKPSPDDAGIAEQRSNVVRASAGRDVEVLGGAIEQEIPDAAADDVGLVAVPSKALDDLDGVRIEAVVAQLHRIAARFLGDPHADLAAGGRRRGNARTVPGCCALGARAAACRLRPGRPRTLVGAQRSSSREA
jgi:hypothetical protein